MSFGLSASTLISGASAIGGLLGGGGSSQSSSTKAEMDPAMRPYIFGDDKQKGLLQYASGLMGQQMAPGGLPGYDLMQQRGMQLMSAPIAGNPFASGYKGGTNFGAAPTAIGQYQAPPVQQQQIPQQPAPQQAMSSIEEILKQLQAEQLRQSNAIYDPASPSYDPYAGRG